MPLAPILGKIFSSMASGMYSTITFVSTQNTSFESIDENEGLALYSTWRF